MTESRSIASLLVIIILFVPLLLTSCKEPNKRNDVDPPGEAIIGDATTIQLQSGENTIFLSDYFMSDPGINAFSSLEGHTVDYNKHNGNLKIINTGEAPLIQSLTAVTTKGSYDLIVKRSKSKKVDFSWNPGNKSPNAVQLVGDINAWNPANTPLSLEDGKWITSMYLVPGTYGYQVVVDGEWILDDNNPEKISNGIGGYNSTLVVPGPDEEKLPRIRTNKFNKGEIILSVDPECTEVFAMLQNRRIPAEIEGKEISIHLPKWASNAERSNLSVIGYNDEGLSNDLLIPMAKGRPIMGTNKLSREDKHRNIIYFMMVDRFSNGEAENDRLTDDKGIHPRANFHGGDIKGITKKLKDGYFEELGINTIWLSPIPKNPEEAFGFYNEGGVTSTFSSYHGYWPTSFTQIDDRFGNAEDLKELVNEAHARDMNVLLDFVSNHVHENHPVYQANKDKGWATNLYLPDGSLNTEKWDEHRLTTWFDVFLPTLNLEKQEVTEMVSDSAIWWLKEYGVDGFRHDATKHIPENFWRTLTKKVKELSVEEGRPVYQIGETYGTPALIASYISSGMLDGQFDFNGTDAMISAICKEDSDFDFVAERLKQSHEYYGTNNLMGYMTGNQDRPRFMALATGDVRFDEDHKLAGWTRMIEKKTPEGYAKLGLMHALNFTIPGVPCIYYGDEIGLTGGNDPDNRRMMKFEGLNENETELKGVVAKLADLRTNRLELIYGDFDVIYAEDEAFVFSRSWFNNTSYVIINNFPIEHTFTIDVVSKDKLKGQFVSTMISEGRQRMVTLPPYSFEILTSE